MPRPRSYRNPTDADKLAPGKHTAQNVQRPYLAHADFDSDGRSGHAWLFAAVNGQGWAPFAFLARANGGHQAWQFARDPEGPVLMYGIRVVSPGWYETTCRRGDLECPHPGPESLTLTTPAVELVQFDKLDRSTSGDARSKAFQRTWMTH